ncbi:MAG: putative manganese transporter [Candidatus Omnitrophica bacterium]|nr:putative manganese transporter [Candidatus Omnitrophota bacterium]
MNPILLDALKDTLAMLPWLLGIYIALEILENKSESILGEKISHKMGSAPFLGALLGCMPQCGFSVIAATLYTRRCISRGTLLAVFISTSDEAIPVILAQHDKASLVLWLLLVKVTIATLAGYTVDLIFRKDAPRESHAPHAPIVPKGGHRHCDCHGHGRDISRWKTFFFFPLKHTLKVLFFIFAVSLAIGVFVAKFGETGLDRIFLTGTFFQPLIAVLVGLIPNCAASVAITEVYLKGGITFGSAIAGLSASGGLGLLVLFKENTDRRETALITGLLVLISLTAGILLNLFL